MVWKMVAIIWLDFMIMLCIERFRHETHFHFSVLFDEKMLQKYKFYEIMKFVLSPRRPSYGLAMRLRNGFSAWNCRLVRLHFDYNSSKAEVIRKCSVPWLCRIFRVNIFKNKKRQQNIYIIKAGVCGHSNVRTLTSPPVLMLWGIQGYLWLPYDLTEVIKLFGVIFKQK